MNPNKKNLISNRLSNKLNKNLEIRNNNKKSVKTNIFTKKTYNCPNCKYQTSFENYFKKHMRHCKSSSITNSHSLITSDKIQFKCKVCPFSTNFQKGFKSHLRKHKRERSFSCKYCSFKATEKIHIAKHAMKHHPKKKL